MTKFYLIGTAKEIVTLSDNAYVIRNDGVSYLSTRPMQPGQFEFALRKGERVYNDPSA